MCLLWIHFVIYVSCLSLLCCLDVSLYPCAHLLGKGQTSWLSGVWCFLVFRHFPIWCPVSGVVLDCIGSRSLFKINMVRCVFFLYLSQQKSGLLAYNKMCHCSGKYGFIEPI